MRCGFFLTFQTKSGRIGLMATLRRSLERSKSIILDAGIIGGRARLVARSLRGNAILISTAPPLCSLQPLNNSTFGKRGRLRDRDALMTMHPFIAPELLLEVDLPATHQRLTTIVKTAVLPRLVQMHTQSSIRDTGIAQQLSADDIEKLAHLVLDPNIQLSSDFIGQLEDEGHSIEDLFVNLLEPAARCLGTMWDNDECSFIDVTLGVARLQQLLSMFSRSYAVPEFRKKRSVCMLTLADEQHSFGAKMVENFLRAGGWAVSSRHRASVRQITEIISRQWFAVVGLTISSSSQCPLLASTIRTIRSQSCNPAIGVMVGGPPFVGHAEMVAEVGADATAINAPAAVLMAQRLFDIGAADNWQGQTFRKAD